MERLVDPADLKALNETFATIERGINNLNARLVAVMAFVAAQPGAARVDEAQLERLLASLRMRPVLDTAPTQPEDFVREALGELRRMADSLEAVPRRKPDLEAVDILARHAKRAE
jgi:hypothetical protein